MSEKPKKVNVDKVLKALKACYDHADHENCPYNQWQYDCQDRLLDDAITAIEQLLKEQGHIKPSEVCGQGGGRTGNRVLIHADNRHEKIVQCTK